MNQKKGFYKIDVYIYYNTLKSLKLIGYLRYAFYPSIFVDDIYHFALKEELREHQREKHKGEG